MYSYLSFAITERSLKEKRMQQPPDQGWPPQIPQQGYGQPTTGYGQPPLSYPQQQEQWKQQPHTPLPQPPQYYPPQQEQWQQPFSPNPQLNQQPYGYPPPPRKKKSKLLLIVAVVVVFVLFACVGASALAIHAGNSNTGTATNSSSLNSTSTSVTTPTAKHFNQTDAVQVGNIFNIEIVSVKTSTGSQLFQPKAGDVYLVFLIKVKNISSQEQAVSSLLDFTLLDINGQKYTETIDPDAGATIDGKIEPGSLLQGSIVYEVPASMKNFTLAFQAVLTLPGQVIWNINV